MQGAKGMPALDAKDSRRGWAVQAYVCGRVCVWGGEFEGGRGPRWWKGLALGSGKGLWKRDETDCGPLRETKKSVLTGIWAAHGKGQARALCYMKQNICIYSGTNDDSLEKNNQRQDVVRSIERPFWWWFCT